MVELRYEKHWQRTDAHRDAKEKNGLELNCQKHKSKGIAMKRRGKARIAVNCTHWQRMEAHRDAKEKPCIELPRTERR